MSSFIQVRRTEGGPRTLSSFASLSETPFEVVPSNGHYISPGPGALCALGDHSLQRQQQTCVSYMLGGEVLARYLVSYK